MADTRLSIIVDAQDNASSTLKNLQGSLRDMQPAFKAMAAAGTVAFAAIAGEGVAALKEFADAEKQMTIANQALSNTMDALSVGAANRLQQQIGEGADMFEYLSGKMKETGQAALKLGFDDEEASVAFAKLYQVSQDVTQAQSDMALAMDLSAFSGRSLEESAAAVTKVHAGATRVLKEFGIEVEKDLTPLEGLALLNTRVAGSADAASKTIEGQTRILTQQFNNLQQAIGAALAPALTQLLEKLQPVVAKFTEWAELNPKTVASVLLAGGTISGLVAILGGLGAALPGIITMFSLLITPIGLAVIAFATIIGVIVFFHDRIGELMQTIDEKTGLITFMKEAWDAVAVVVQQELMPALAELWTSLQPYMPFLQALAQVFGAILVGAITLVAMGLAGLAILATKLITAFSQTVAWINTHLLPIFGAIGDAIATVVNWVEKLIAALSKLNVAKAATSFLSSVGSVIGVHDAIISPAGHVITTDPADYLIATKDPSSLGGGKSINININGAIFTDEAAEKLGDILYDRLSLQMRGA